MPVRCALASSGYCLFHMKNSGDSNLRGSTRYGVEWLSEKVDFGSVTVHLCNIVVSGPKFNKLFILFDHNVVRFSMS